MTVTPKDPRGAYHSGLMGPVAVGRWTHWPSGWELTVHDPTHMTWMSVTPEVTRCITRTTPRPVEDYTAQQLWDIYGPYPEYSEEAS